MQSQYEMVKERLAQLGINWNELPWFSSEWIPQEDFCYAHTRSGKIPCWQNLLVGSNAFCLLTCELVKVLNIEDKFVPETTRLWVMKTPQALLEIDPDIKPAWCLPVNPNHPWPTWNSNPIPLDRVEDAEQYQTGWMP